MRTPTTALVAWLNRDQGLLASATGGVWLDPGPPDEDGRPFVTVSALSVLAEYCGGGAATLECLYAVKAVGMAAQIEAVRVAAGRLEALLGVTIGPRVLRRHDLEGFEVQSSQAESAIERTDPEDATGLRYEHRGANYRLRVDVAS